MKWPIPEREKSFLQTLVMHQSQTISYIFSDDINTIILQSQQSQNKRRQYLVATCDENSLFKDALQRKSFHFLTCSCIFPMMEDKYKII